MAKIYILYVSIDPTLLISIFRANPHSIFLAPKKKKRKKERKKKTSFIEILLYFSFNIVVNPIRQSRNVHVLATLYLVSYIFSNIYHWSCMRFDFIVVAWTNPLNNRMDHSNKTTYKRKFKKKKILYLQSQSFHQGF
jgi:hypothetical protein